MTATAPTYGPGRIVTAHFSTGQALDRNCTCECHDDCDDEKPLPPGVYITVQLDDDNARVGLGRVYVQSIRAPEAGDTR